MEFSVFYRTCSYGRRGRTYAVLLKAVEVAVGIRYLTRTLVVYQTAPNSRVHLPPDSVKLNSRVTISAQFNERRIRLIRRTGDAVWGSLPSPVLCTVRGQECDSAKTNQPFSSSTKEVEDGEFCVPPP